MPKRPKKCPLCGKPESDKFAPFCSAGCKDRDLLKWLGGGYRIPGRAAEPDELIETDQAPGLAGVDSAKGGS